MKKILLLVTILVCSCSSDENSEILEPRSPEEIAAELAKRESDSLMALYGNTIEANGLTSIQFLFERENNTYLAGKLNRKIWIGAFENNFSNQGEITFNNEIQDFKISSSNIKTIDEQFFFSVYVIDKATESFYPLYTRLILNHSYNSLKGIKQNFSENHGNEVNDVMIGYNNGYLFETTGDLYPMGTNEILYVSSDFEESTAWQGTCYPNIDYAVFEFVNTSDYLFSNEESYVSYVDMQNCEQWEITISDIFNYSCLNCSSSLEVLDFSETEVKIIAGLLGSYREVKVDSSTGEIISNLEV